MLPSARGCSKLRFSAPLITCCAMPTRKSRGETKQPLKISIRHYVTTEDPQQQPKQPQRGREGCRAGQTKLAIPQDHHQGPYSLPHAASGLSSAIRQHWTPQGHAPPARFRSRPSSAPAGRRQSFSTRGYSIYVKRKPLASREKRFLFS